MVVYSDIKILLFMFLAIAGSSYAEDLWVSSGKCGTLRKLSDGRPGQCNPNGKHPCCGKSGWCGKTPGHCACDSCIDYRTNVTTTTTTKPPRTESTTLQPTTLEATTLEATTLEPTILEPTTLEATTLEATTLEPTILEPTTLEPTTLEATTPEPSTEEPTTITSESSTSVEITIPVGQIGPRGGRKLPTSTSDEETTTSGAAGDGTAAGHDMDATPTSNTPHESGDAWVTPTSDADAAGGTAAGHGVDTSPTSNTPHESGDAWIGLVIALCVILLIGVACLINIIRNKRKSGTQNISLTETGVGNASQSKEKKTKVSYSNQGTLPSEERNPQITITTPHMESQDKAGAEVGTDDVDGGKSNAAFSENQDEAMTKPEDTKKDQVEGSKESLVEKDNSNDEVNTNIEEQTEGKGVSNGAVKE